MKGENDMSVVYCYQVTYVDYCGRTHIFFCQNKNDVDRLRDNYNVKEVVPIRYVVKSD